MMKFALGVVAGILGYVAIKLIVGFVLAIELYHVCATRGGC